MVKEINTNLPQDLEKFIRRLRSSSCPINWDWEKMYSILESSGRHGSSFWSICDSGIYHFLHEKTTNKDSSIKCKEFHSPSVNILQFAGACFSRLMFTGLVVKRNNKFRDMLIQVVSSLLDSIIISLEISDFSAQVLQSMKVCQNLRLPGLQRLLIADRGTHGPKVCMQIALCRIDLLSSTLRCIFECGFQAELPVCVPYICNMIASSLSVNHCDPIHTSSDIIQCWQRLLNCFSTVFLSCGIHISPSVSNIITGLVYQLEWSSQYTQSHPTSESFLHKLSVYRCISSIMQASAQMSSTTIVRLMPRIISQISHDITTATNLCNIRLELSSTDASVFELKLCSAVAAILLCEQLFIGHAYAIYDVLSNEASFNDRYTEDNPAYKLKKVIFQVNGDLLQFVKRLIILMSKNVQISPNQSALLRPYLLIPTLNAINSIETKNMFSYGSSVFKIFAHLLLRHEDPIVRLCAERSLQKTYDQAIANPLFLASLPTELLPITIPATKPPQINMNVPIHMISNSKPNKIDAPLTAISDERENNGLVQISSVPDVHVTSIIATQIEEVPLQLSLDIDYPILDVHNSSNKRTHPNEEFSLEKRQCPEEIETTVRPAFSNFNIPILPFAVSSLALAQQSLSENSSLDAVLCTFDDTLS